MGNSTNETDDLCEQAKMITGTPQMRVILTLECVFGPAAIFPNLMTIWLLCRVRVFHLNLRLLLAHMSFDLVFYSVTIAEKAFRRLLTPICELAVYFPRCVLTESAVAIPLHNSMLALIVLLLERLYATIRFRTYDKGQKRPYLAMFLWACTWASTLGIQLSNYAKAPPKMVPLCETGLSSSPTQIASVVATFVSLEIVAVGLMIFIFFYNRYLLRFTVLNRAHFDLSSRFQVDQNVTVNAALMPSAILHVICYLPNYTFLLLTLVDSISGAIHIPIETRAWLLHLSLLWRLIYACAYPVLLVTLNPNLKQGLFKTMCGRLLLFVCRCGKARKTQDVATQSKDVTLAHFSQLEKMWGVASQNRVRRTYC